VGAEVTRLESISVVIPTRNRSQLLQRAIASALNSGETCGEVLVVDDGSVDDTPEVVAAISDDRVRYLYSDSNGGPAARNIGFRAANNSLIKFLDDDDYLLPGALTKQLAYFQSLSVTSRDQAIVYGDPRVTGQFLARLSWREVPARRREHETDVEYLTRVNIQTSCPLHQRHLLDIVGGFDESLSASQENDLHLRLALHGAQFVHAPGDVYVFDNSSMRSRISTQKKDRFVIESRLSLLVGRQGMLSEFYNGSLPNLVRQTLARDFRECQRWARSAKFGDLEIACSERAKILYSGGPFEDRFSGTSVYGGARRARVKAGKRIRGFVARCSST
jgi:glycosyltransferase involved in cell wall biosynthesis